MTCATVRHISGFADLLLKDLADRLDEKGSDIFHASMMVQKR